jgi:hypothetical protein
VRGWKPGKGEGSDCCRLLLGEEPEVGLRESKQDFMDLPKGNKELKEAVY